MDLTPGERAIYSTGFVRGYAIGCLFAIVIVLIVLGLAKM